jgi:NAD(P)-dependent dehydrogenase (short-subunit alcohol dehydrogenase family)
MAAIEFSLYPEPARLLFGRRALVTGGDSGIGRSTCLELAAHGAAVAINHVGDAAEAEAMAVAIEDAGGRAVPVQMDVSQERDVERAFAEAAEALGGLDLLVNNAGLQEPYELAEMPLASWQKVIGVNLTGAFLCCREAARLMERGTIVVNTSVHEIIPWMRFSHYAASKGGLRMFVQSIAKELAPRDIRVCSVAPGATRTPINADAEESVEAIPLGRWAEPEEMARAIAWLASDQASYVVGTTLYVDGGMTLYPRLD